MVEMVSLEIAHRLEEVAQLLDDQGANPYRVQAYRNAAQTLRRLDQPITEILQRDGMDGLRQLPGIGESLARSIHALTTTGRLPMLERLRGESDPVALLASVPSIGKVLARRGCRYCTPNAASGTTRLCSRTRRERTSWA